jgi:hypothetical protein
VDWIGKRRFTAETAEKRRTFGENPMEPGNANSHFFFFSRNINVQSKRKVDGR